MNDKQQQLMITVIKAITIFIILVMFFVFVYSYILNSYDNVMKDVQNQGLETELEMNKENLNLIEEIKGKNDEELNKTLDAEFGDAIYDLMYKDGIYSPTYPDAMAGDQNDSEGLTYFEDFPIQDDAGNNTDK